MCQGQSEQPTRESAASYTYTEDERYSVHHTAGIVAQNCRSRAPTTVALRGFPSPRGGIWWTHQPRSAPFDAVPPDTLGVSANHHLGDEVRLRAPAMNFHFHVSRLDGVIIHVFRLDGQPGVVKAIGLGAGTSHERTEGGLHGLQASRRTTSRQSCSIVWGGAVQIAAEEVSPAQCREHGNPSSVVDGNGSRRRRQAYTVGLAAHT